MVENNTEILIRTARLSDADDLIAFNQAMAQETEKRVLKPEIISAGVHALFQNPEWGFYIVAEVDSRNVGCLMITYEWSDWRNGLFWWIQSVYVRPEFRRRGIYQKMYDHIQEAALKAGNVCGLRLYVERDNRIAQTTYRQLGMSKTNYILFETTELIKPSEK
ncbi:MAG TPA: N-acetyltransferase [Candidatus Marinimicrobia bacterium]|nr:N-acetyltransferase [Candidatus Neomarinimicrobiota bacterium]HRS50873.1 N-acetyltransferase [Candidatus Neomarinimicrobiota bacterium]HRU91785.1 N-acetyltransferase [Candidatus Neomarinimicrobiota bacterium]